MDDNPADSVVIPDWIADIEKSLSKGKDTDNVLWDRVMLPHQTLAVCQEVRQMQVVINDLLADRGITPDGTVYAVTEEYNNGSDFASETVWIGPLKRQGCAFIRSRLSESICSGLHNPLHVSCKLSTWRDGKTVSTQTFLPPGVSHCPRCDGAGTIKDGPNSSVGCKNCDQLGVVLKAKI